MHTTSTRTTTAGRAIVHVPVDRRLPLTLTRQVYDGILVAIRTGRLPARAALPSTRALARDLSLARSTVNAAFEQLRAEGWIEGSRGSVARVSTRIQPEPACLPPGPLPSTPPRPVVLSDRGRRVAELPSQVMDGFAGDSPRPFRSGVPALDLFPMELWGRLLSRAWRRSSPRSLGYGDPQGHLPLRAAIAQYLRSARGLPCTEEHIVICSGAQQAIDLVSRVLLDQGDEVWIEDPGYVGAHGSLLANGLRPVPVAVDAQGLDVAEGRRVAPRAKLAYVTPARQAPLGVVMSEARRHELLAWAAETGAWILEDDYDSELQYASRPPVPLCAIDRNVSVILAGTFSKVLFPALRLGYLVAPPALAHALARTRLFTDVASAQFHQAVLADFIAEGHFERHIRKMRAVYQRRQALLIRLLRRRLGPDVDVSCAAAGMNLVLWLPPTASDVHVADAARRSGLEVLPMSRLTLRSIPPPRQGLLLGFGGVRDVDLIAGVERLAAVLAS